MSSSSTVPASSLLPHTSTLFTTSGYHCTCSQSYCVLVAQPFFRTRTLPTTAHHTEGVATTLPLTLRFPTSSSPLQWGSATPWWLQVSGEEQIGNSSPSMSRYCILFSDSCAHPTFFCLLPSSPPFFLVLTPHTCDLPYLPSNLFYPPFSICPHFHNTVNKSNLNKHVMRLSLQQSNLLAPNTSLHANNIKQLILFCADLWLHN